MNDLILHNVTKADIFFFSHVTHWWPQIPLCKYKASRRNSGLCHKCHFSNYLPLKKILESRYRISTKHARKKKACSCALIVMDIMCKAYFYEVKWIEWVVMTFTRRGFVRSLLGMHHWLLSNLLKLIGIKIIIVNHYCDETNAPNDF